MLLEKRKFFISDLNLQELKFDFVEVDEFQVLIKENYKNVFGMVSSNYMADDIEKERTHLLHKQYSVLHTEYLILRDQNDQFEEWVLSLSVLSY